MPEAGTLTVPDVEVGIVAFCGGADTAANLDDDHAEQDERNRGRRGNPSQQTGGGDERDPRAAPITPAAGGRISAGLMPGARLAAAPGRPAPPGKADGGPHTDFPFMLRRVEFHLSGRNDHRRRAVRWKHT